MLDSIQGHTLQPAWLHSSNGIAVRCHIHTRSAFTLYACTTVWCVQPQCVIIHGLLLQCLLKQTQHRYKARCITQRMAICYMGIRSVALIEDECRSMFKQELSMSKFSSSDHTCKTPLHLIVVKIPAALLQHHACCRAPLTGTASCNAARNSVAASTPSSSVSSPGSLAPEGSLASTTTINSGASSSSLTRWNVAHLMPPVAWMCLCGFLCQVMAQHQHPGTCVELYVNQDH